MIYLTPRLSEIPWSFEMILGNEHSINYVLFLFYLLGIAYNLLKKYLPKSVSSIVGYVVPLILLTSLFVSAAT